MVTTDHTTANIQCFLLKLVRDVCRITKRFDGPIRIEVDMSWALLHAACRSLSGLKLDWYLKEAWEFAINKDKQWRVCTVHICAAHMIHLVSIKLRYVKGKSLRVYTMYCFARLQNCKTIKKQVHCSKICVLLLAAHALQQM